MMTEKKAAKKKAGAKKDKPEVTEAVTPEAVDKPVDEHFETGQAFGEGNIYTVKFANKKLEGRTLEQVIGLVTGLDGAAKKITIELE